MVEGVAAAEEDLWLFSKVFTANSARFVVGASTTRDLLHLRLHPWHRHRHHERQGGNRYINIDATHGRIAYVVYSLELGATSFHSSLVRAAGGHSTSPILCARLNCHPGAMDKDQRRVVMWDPRRVGTMLPDSPLYTDFVYLQAYPWSISGARGSMPWSIAPAPNERGLSDTAGSIMSQDATGTKHLHRHCAVRFFFAGDVCVASKPSSERTVNAPHGRCRSAVRDAHTWQLQ